MDFFEFFCLMLGIYGLWCLYTGEVSGRNGTGWTTWTRRDHPWGYWLGVGSYLTIAVFALVVLPAMKS